MVGADEVMVNIAGSKQWLDGAWTELLSAYQLGHSTGRAAVDGFVVLSGYAGTLVRDAAAVYDTYRASDALCGGHLFCEFTALAESRTERVWPIRVCTALAQLADLAGYARQRRPDSVPQHGPRPGAAPVLPGRPGRSGRAPASPGRQVDQGLRPAGVDARARGPDPAVCRRPGRGPCQRNGSERDLGLVKTQIEIFGCYRWLTGARSWLRIHSYFSVVSKHHRDLYGALDEARTGDPWRPPGPARHARSGWLPACV